MGGLVPQCRFMVLEKRQSQDENEDRWVADAWLKGPLRFHPYIINHSFGSTPIDGNLHVVSKMVLLAALVPS